MWKCFCSRTLLNFTFHLAQVLGALWLCLVIKARWSSFGSCLSLVQKWDVAVVERKIEKQKALAAGVGRGAEFLSFPAPSPVQAQQHLDVPSVKAALGIQPRRLWKAVVPFIRPYLESVWWLRCSFQGCVRYLWQWSYSGKIGLFAGFCLRTFLWNEIFCFSGKDIHILYGVTGYMVLLDWCL